MKGLITIVVFLLIGSLYSQSIETEWKHKPFSNLGFAENNNRFDPINGAEVLYYGRYGDFTFYMANNQLSIAQTQTLSGNKLKERHEKMERGQQVEPLYNVDYFHLKWVNSNSNVIILPQEKNQHTLNFQDPINTEKTIISATYNALIYQNIYPNIDLEFTLPESGGLKYAFIVHPGGNPEEILLEFIDADISLLENGSLEIKSSIDLFIDRKPIAWFANSKINSPVNYTLNNNNTCAFIFENYDTTKTLIIDPWLVPALSFTDTQQGYDIAADFNGNCSVLGQHGNEVAYYDNTGTLQWVWMSPGSLNLFYGGLDMNPYSGDTYYMFMSLFLGIQDVWRLDPLGVVNASIYLIPAEDDPGELWRLNYNRITDQVVIGAGGLPRESHIVVLDGDLTTKEQYAPLTPVPPNLTDATLLEIDPLGEYFYFLPSGDAEDLYNNVLYKVNQADPTSIVWESNTNYTFSEISCVYYMGYETYGDIVSWYSVNGYNGIACSFDLYTYDGDSLSRWNKLTGELINSIFISPFDIITESGDLATCGGIDTDPCGNVYIGTEDSLIIFTRELDYIEAYALPDTCYDVRFAEESLFASGKDFVQSWSYDMVNLDLSSTPQPCGFCEGTATIIPTAICPELEVVTVLWMPGGQTGSTATDLCAGWYTATVEWANEIGDTLSRVDSVEVLIGAPGTLDIDITPQTCSEICNGNITITVIGGFAPFVFDLEGEINATGIYTELCEGTYELMVTDVDGCIFNETVIIEDLDSILVTEIVTNEACAGACNGTITLIPDSGLEPFVFQVGGDINESGEFENLCAGEYNILVIDSNDCAYTSTIEISIGASLGLDTIHSNNPTCYGFSDGSVTVSTILGEDPVAYTWIPENPIEGPVFNTMTAGIYTVSAIDANGCMDTLVFELLQPDSIYATISITDPLCFGDATGFVVVDSVFNTQGDFNNTTFIWSPNPAEIGGVGADSSYNMTAGEYLLTINDDFGCSSVISILMNQPNQLVFSELGFDPAYCRIYDYQSGNGVVYAAAIGGVPDYSYNWVNLETLESSGFSTWGGLNPGYYRITVTDDNGCVLTETVQLDSVNPKAAFTVNSDQLDENCEGTELVLANFINQSEYFANPNNPEADSVFFWILDYPDGLWFISHDYFEEIDTNYVGEAIYKVCLVASNKNGCKDTTCKDIIVHVQPKFTAPNIFSPGTNGINDQFTFEFLSIGIETFNCVIVNRWGIKVAELNSIEAGWDGTDFKGNDCSDGVYFYTYQAVSTNGTVYTGQGNVQLVKD